MVGCGGFGAANAGAVIIVRAAAKEPAIVALAKAFFEFMGVILSPEYRALRRPRHEHSFNQRSAGESGDSRVQSNPVEDGTSGMSLDYWPRRHNIVMEMGFCKSHWFQIVGATWPYIAENANSGD
jgi:hypothetical protein